jgi:hypothetical protein
MGHSHRKGKFVLTRKLKKTEPWLVFSRNGNQRVGKFQGGGNLFRGQHFLKLVLFFPGAIKIA